MKKTLQETIESINQEILKGLTFTTPGATEEARREGWYCQNLTCKNCASCPLVSYGRDCHNNTVEFGVTYQTGYSS